MQTFRTFLEGLGVVALAYVLLCGAAVLVPSPGLVDPPLEAGSPMLDVDPADLPLGEGGIDEEAAYWRDLP